MQAAALFLAATECAENATTYGTKQYMTGVRDAFESVFRACHDVDDHEDAYAAAREVIEGLPSEKERVDLLTRAHSMLYRRKQETVPDDTFERIVSDIV